MEPKDHDILIRIATQVERLIIDLKDVRTDIADVKSDLANRVALLENEKQSKEEAKSQVALTDSNFTEVYNQLRAHQAIIDFLVSKYWWAVGVGAAITVVFGLLSSYILQHLK